MKKYLFTLISLMLLLSLCLTACPASELPQVTTGTTTSSQGNQPSKPEEEKEPMFTPDQYKNGVPLYAEQYRQQFHFSPKDSWMNDINGSVYFNGVWHMYYQTTYGTVQVDTNRMYWGHATSPDLVHWTEHAPALEPDSDGAMWSGTCCVDPDNRTGLFKTDKGGVIAAYSTEKQELGIAYSEDGYTFEKLGIVIHNPGPGVVDFRDPKIFWDESNEKWTVCVAGGKVRFYQSDDLRTWTLTSENDIWTECPDFFPLTVEGEDTVKWVLSLAGSSFCVGSYANGRFTPETGIIKTCIGPDAYAGIIFANEPNDRALIVHWSNRWEYAQLTATDWVSNASLVSELVLRRTGDGYTVAFETVDVYESIMSEPILSLSNVAVGAGENPLADASATLYRLDLEIDLAQTTDFMLVMRRGKGEGIKLSYNKRADKFVFDRSGTITGCAALSEATPYYTFTSKNSDGKTLSLTVYVDTSMVEMYIDHNSYFAAIAQPQMSSRGLSLTTEDSLVIKSLVLRELDTVWFEDGNLVGGVQTEKVDAYELVMTEDALFVPASSFCGKWPIHCTVEEGGDFFRAEAVEGGFLLTPLAVGEGRVRLRTLDRYIDVPVKVYAETLRESMLDGFSVSGGTLRATQTAYTLTSSSGDAFAISSVGASDFIYEAEITLRGEARAGALAFRMNGTTDFYCVCLDRWSQYVKLWMRDGGTVRDLRTVSLEVLPDVTYILRIEAVGNQIKVSVDGREIMTVTDNAHSFGAFGFNTYMGAADFNKIKYEKQGSDTDSSGVVSEIDDFLVLSGSLLESPEGYRFTSPSGDSFARAGEMLTDFVYEADITLDGGKAGALVFRMTNFSNFYCCCISASDRVVKLWKKDFGTSSTLATYRMTPAQNTTYRLRVEAIGNTVTVFLDGNQLFSVTDDSHTVGALGLNAFEGTAVFNNISYEPKED